MAWSGHPEVCWTQLFLGPVFAGFLVLLLPGNTGRWLFGRLAFSLLAVGAGALAYKGILEAGGTISHLSEEHFRFSTGLREEGVKLLAAMVLARASTWARDWPNRLVIIGIASGFCFGGFENIQYLSTTSALNLFNRSSSLVAHASLTGLAISGAVAAQYLRCRGRWILPALTFCAAVASHEAHNHWVRPVHAWLLVRVDNLPEVMTSEQWFGAPHYDELMILVNGSSRLPVIALLAVMMGVCSVLARTREARL